MRSIVWSGVLLLFGAAFNLTVGKYGGNVPDWVIISLWLLPLIPFAYWLYTHPKLIKQRQWYAARFQAQKLSTLFVTSIVVAILFSSVGSAAHRGWKVLTKRSSVEATVQLTTIPAQPPAPIAVASPDDARRSDAQMASKHIRKNAPIGDAVPLDAPPRNANNSRLAQEINAPNGIAIGGGTVNNPTVNNLTVPRTRIIASGRDSRETGNPKTPWATDFMLSATDVVAIGIIRFVFDGPVLGTQVQSGSSSLGIRRMGRDPSDPNAVLIDLSAPETISSENGLRITVFSEDPIKIAFGTLGDREIEFVR